MVQRLGPKSYRFIELKVDSDNPLYAAFEILGYGLGYCLARHHGCEGTGTHNVMEATRVELQVLAPEPRYKFNHRGSTEPHKFDLSWLVSAINVGLAAEIKTLNLDGLDQITFAFRKYSSSVAAAAKEIVGTSSSR